MTRRANEPVPLDPAYGLEAFTRNSEFPEDIIVPAEYQKRPRHQYNMALPKRIIKETERLQKEPYVH